MKGIFIPFEALPDNEETNLLASIPVADPEIGRVEAEKYVHCGHLFYIYIFARGGVEDGDKGVMPGSLLYIMCVRDSLHSLRHCKRCNL